MNGIFYGDFPYVYPLLTASAKCRERYLGFKFIALIPAIIFPAKDIFTMCYGYFRWLDDIVDSLRLKPEISEFQIKRQLDWLDNLYGHEIRPEDIATEELFLSHLVWFDRQRAGNMYEDLKRLLLTLEFDRRRKGKICSKVEIEEYADNMSVSYTNIALKIFGQFNGSKEKLYQLARDGFIIDYLDDLREDIQLGFINIPGEEIEIYGIDLQDLDSKNVNAWLSDKIIQAEQSFAHFSEGTKNIRGWAKVIALAMLWKRSYKLRRLKKNN